MIDYNRIIDKYYQNQSRLREILITHSRLVADKALKCAAVRNLTIDREFVEEAAMLHDIGIFLCDAPGILCFRDKPYICHGVEGSKLLQEEGLPRHALVCERHTGAGLTIEDIKRQQLPLPLRDMTPVSLEEKLVCYADKFYSKSGNLEAEKSIEKVIASMARHGEETLNRFLALHALFG
ncbi:MAG: HD domain-containing protein [Bacteroidales bacterium]|nr:HD domain-containing protein [Bacteroidales bacterium]